MIGFGGYPALARLARRAARPHPDPDPRAECGARPGQPADGGQGRRDRHRLSEGRAAAGQGARTRSIWSAIRSATRSLALRDQPFPPLDRGRHLPPARHRRQPGRLDPVRGRARGARLCCPSISAGGSRSPSNAAPRISSGSAPAMPRSASRPISPPICPICPSGSAGRISSSPAPAPRPSPS